MGGGLDNPGFDSLSIQEKASKGSSSGKPGDPGQANYPENEERILLWQFEEPAESYLQISEDKTGLKSEAAGASAVEFCDLYLSECLGYIRIPFMLAILIGGHFLM